MLVSGDIVASYYPSIVVEMSYSNLHRRWLCCVSEADLHGPIPNSIPFLTSGIVVHKPALEIDKDDFDEIFGVNVWGAFSTAQAAALWVHHSAHFSRSAVQRPGSKG